MGSRKKTNQKKAIAPALVYYKSLNVNERINFKAYWQWHGRLRINLLDMKKGLLNIYGNGIKGVEEIKIPY